MEKNTFQKIYDVVREIPPGCVASYGQVAALAGSRRWARAVGYALNANRDPDLPCHRVVNREGRVSDAFMENGINRQIILLEQEGVKCSEGKVDMSIYQWKKRVF
ncbi:MAG: MGMT family protein [Ruminococcus sp.]|jgi:methylated-DNA-protein-cysteine methyltransferase-like protein